MRILKLFVLFVLLMGAVSAITIVSPVETEVGEKDIIDAGTIGPGQTISVLIEPEVTEGGKFGTGGYYDYAAVTSVPEGWGSDNSKLYGNPLQVTITAAPDAEEGYYHSTITVEDEFYGDGLDNVTFSVRVTVSYDVVDISIEPEYVKTAPGIPATFGITISNKASTGDAFEIKSEGVKRWEFERSVFVPAESSKTIYYEIAGEEEETYDMVISVESLASPIIHDEKEVTVDIHSSIADDLKAINNGVLIFPIFEGIVYAFLGLISNFL